MKEGIDISLQLLAAGYINKQLAKLMMHLQDARDAKDIEDIHQSRVACRRIRSALVLFHDCFEDNAVKTWEKQIRKLLKSFGSARDLDVQIEFLQGKLKELDVEHKKYRPGIRRMLLRWQQRRDKVQTRVIKTIDVVQKKHLLTNIHIQMERVLFELKPLNQSLDTPAVYERANEQIQHHTDELLKLHDRLNDPEDFSGHHAMRIAAKKLRYAMEICDTALKGILKPAIKKVKQIQTLLGDLHDCDVWDVDIGNFIEQEKHDTIEFYGHHRPFMRILPGLLYLQQERKSHRQELYTQAKDYMDQLETETFWQKFPQRLQPDKPPQGESELHDKPDDTKSDSQADPPDRNTV